MDLKNISSKEFLNLSEEEQEATLNKLEDLTNKYKELSIAKKLKK